MSTPPAPSPAAPAVSSTVRHGEVDALRGLALIGILVTNIPQMTGMRASETIGGPMLPIPAVLELVAHQRFFPIFTFLFGLSVALFLDGSAAQAPRPRLLLARRLVVLACFGLLHQLAQPGEALLPYAVVGLVVLLPASWLPRPALLLGGLGLVIAPLALGASGTALLPGLFLLGMATARYDVPATLHRRGSQLALFGLGCAAVAAVTVPVQLGNLVNSGFDRASAIAGLAIGGLWMVALLGALRTRARPALLAVLSPLGRTALSNYVAATAAILLLAPLIGLPGSTAWAPMLALAAGIVLVQVPVSRWWLGRFRYGPLEWVWRTLTWWRPVPQRG